MCNGDDCSQPLSSHQLLRTVAVSVQGACMLVTLLLTFLVFRYRKCKAIAGSAWILLELILVGALLLYSLVVVRYFESSTEFCLLEPWLRELGFTFCYGTIVLKIYRLLVEFRTRKAHRWVVREKDLLKYWTVMITCVLVYLTSGTISTLQHSEYSMWAWGSADNNDTNTSNITSVAPMQIFPKSGVSGADGARTRYSNSTFMLQKARFLRRQSDGDRLPTPQPILINDTDVNYDDSFNDSAADIHRIGEAALKRDDSMNSTSRLNDSSLPWIVSDSDSLPNSLLTRYEVNFKVYYMVCRQLWWHYVNIAGELLFLLSGLYISWNGRNAASHHGEKVCLFLAIFFELAASVAYHITSRIKWIVQHPDHLFLLEFARSQLATTLVLVIIFGPKMYFVCRQSTDKQKQRLDHQVSQIEGETIQIPADSEIFKNQDMTAAASISATGEIDFGNVDLTQMDPEVIREELKRVYTQLHVLKMKTLRKDNPHISKRRGGRKSPHRRFSLQNKSMRSTRRPIEYPEETGVDESVCSVDAVNASVPVQSAGAPTAANQSVEVNDLSEITALSVKNLTKF